MSNKATRNLMFFLGLALIFSCLTLSTRAQDDNFRAKATKVTVSEPMQVPGTVLQPGEYIFKLNDSNSNRHIVEIWDKDNKLVTRILAIANERLIPTDKPIMTYGERPTGQPVALEAWFYSGETLGQQFVYPKTKAAELSRLNNTQVPSTNSEEAFPGENLSAQNNVSSPSGNATQRGTNASQAPTSATQTGAASNAETSTSTNPSQTPSSSTAGNRSTRGTAATGTSGASEATGATINDQLPKTASQLPMIAFLGSLFVAFSLLLKVIARS